MPFSSAARAEHGTLDGGRGLGCGAASRTGKRPEYLTKKLLIPVVHPSSTMVWRTAFIYLRSRIPAPFESIACSSSCDGHDARCRTCSNSFLQPLRVVEA